MGITVIPLLMPSRPREAVHDTALSEGKRGEYVSQLLRTSLAAQTLLSLVRVTAMATTFFRIARCPKILKLFMPGKTIMTGIPFRVEGVNMFRDYLEIVGDLAVQTRFLPPLLSREEISIRA